MHARNFEIRHPLIVVVSCQHKIVRENCPFSDLPAVSILDSIRKSCYHEYDNHVSNARNPSPLADAINATRSGRIPAASYPL